MHKVLVLGAGLVSRPVIHYFLQDHEIRLTVGTLFVEDAQALIGEHPTARAVAASVAESEQIAALIGEHDLVVSLVPFHLHGKVAKIAVEQRVHLVTTSYVSEEMRALDSAARAAGVLLLNECGLDPGLDHMSAMRVIDAIHARGGTIVGFESCTGSLPAGEAANNPWQYKFAWSPRGVLVAGTNSARFLQDGAVREIPGAQLFSEVRDYEIDGLARFEMYPNRDSMPYCELYGLNQLRQMLRGTIRYPGWSRAMKAIADLGLLDTQRRSWPAGATYADLATLGLAAGPGSVRERIAAHLGLAHTDDILERLSWSGLFSDEALGTTEAAPLDLLATLLETRMPYALGERDMVVMQHVFDVVAADGRRESHRSQLIAYGDPQGFSATARTVSWPAAIASRAVLEGRLKLRGVQIPNRREIYQPILTALESLGVQFREWVVNDDKNA